MINDNEIYLDNSATTALTAPVIERMKYVMEHIYANPSSLHSAGLEAEKVVTEARTNVLNALGVRGAKDSNLIFCGSGTEANNLAVFGTAYAKNRPVKRIISTDSEHPSIREPLAKLEREGFEIVRLSTKQGVLDIDELKASVDANTVLVSIMAVNNETGAAYDVKSAFAAAKRINPAVVTHCDCVQGFFKLRFTPDSVGADMVTVSSHKIHGPKGVGALYVSTPVLTAKKLVPYILGGGQEHGFRSGTENVIGIAGFGEAVKAGFDSDITASRRAYLIEKLPENVRANIPAGNIAPHILNITLPHIKSETMLHYLSSRGIYVSSGSACSAHSKHVSYSLINFGLSESEADCSMRISLDESTTTAQLDIFIDALTQGLQSLIRS